MALEVAHKDLHKLYKNDDLRKRPTGHVLPRFQVRKVGEK